MRILVTGGTGQVGSALSRRRWPEDIELVMPTRAELDLSNPTAIADYVAVGGFDLVINPAAYTDVDKAETDAVTAWTVNALAAAALAEASARARIPLIHISTDYVFDGSKKGAYVETDPVAPLGVYGASKEGAEQAVRTCNPRHIILRTAWVFSSVGKNFVKTMLRVGATRDQLRVVADQTGCPTSADDIAEAIAGIALRQLSALGAAGTYHFVNAGEATWHGFASEIFRIETKHGMKVPSIEAICTKDFPTPARRPANSVLNTAKLTADYGIHPRPWQEALEEVLAVLRAQVVNQQGETD